jgi:peptidoglycan/LPS O-acetylase OafA/YrhL
VTDTVAIRRGPSSPVLEHVQKRSRLAYLDGWRGLSITLVLIGHFFPVPGINLGLLGVEFFFVLSGRLMAEILFIERYPLKKFFKRRFSRIYPALLVYVLVTTVALSGSFIAFKWKAALTALTFTYNYAAILFTRAGALDHIWSLCVEEHSYVTLAVISLLVAARRNWLPAVLGVLSVLAIANGAISYSVLGLGFEASYWRTDTHIASILLSALVCWLKTDPRWRRFLEPAYVAPLAAIAGAAMFLEWMPTPLHYMIGTLLLAIAVNAVDFGARPFVRLLSAPLAMQIGLWSYSLYLWQETFYKFVYFDMSPALPMLAATFACALASYYIVEKPSREWLNRNW